MHVSVRAMRESDLEQARRIFRVAFGTFIGVPDPESFEADREYVSTRWRANPEAALAAEVDGRLAGSNIASNWGSFGFFGPSALSGDDRQQALSACRELTDSIYEGLDVSCQIRAVREQDLGETLLLWGGGSLDAFAVCHCGQGTEAGRDNCLVKFAAVRPGPRADDAFDRLLAECEALASARGAHRIEAGVNLNRSQAYRRMLRRGFHTTMQGVAMHNPDSPAYNRPDVFVVDDWR